MLRHVAQRYLHHSSPAGSSGKLLISGVHDLRIASYSSNDERAVFPQHHLLLSQLLHVQLTINKTPAQLTLCLGKRQLWLLMASIVCATESQKAAPKGWIPQWLRQRLPEAAGGTPASEETEELTLDSESAEFCCSPGLHACRCA